MAKKFEDIIDEIIIDKAWLETQAAKFVEFHKAAKELKPDSADDDFKNVFTGDGIASISGTMSGLKGSDGKTFTNESYSKKIKENWGNITEKLKDIENFLQNEPSPENDNFLYEKYKDLCEQFPTKAPNNITNRFLSTYFYDKLTTIASWEELKKVIERAGINKECYKKSNNLCWLPMSYRLHKIIKNTPDGNINEKIIPIIGWELVVSLSTEKEIEDMIAILKNNKNLILNGAPGTGKTFLAKKIAEEITKNKSSVQFVQFHPSYDYTDFVEGLRPNDDGTKFERRDGIFKEFCKNALEQWNKTYEDRLTKTIAVDDEKKKEDAYIYAVENAPKYVFIIDEINRGEVSKIFGELFFSIDPGYRGKEGLVRTQYQNLIKQGDPFETGFYVPDNVYIIGTMNDIDRSVESMDIAFRRRFAFYEVKATDNMLSNVLRQKGREFVEATKKLFNAVNESIIQVGLTESYKIGGSYFLKIEKYYKEDSFGIDSFKESADNLWKYHLQGTLYEYFRGEPDAEEKMKSIKDAYDNAIRNLREPQDNKGNGK